MIEKADKESPIDDTSFFSLFGKDGTLTLTNRTISPVACALLEQVIDDALSNTLAALPGERAIEILNRDEVITQQVPYVVITLGETGTLQLPAYQLKLLSFQEIVERLLPDLEVFEMFLFDKQNPYRHAYRYNLVVWQRMDATMMLQYRAWLPHYIHQSEHHAAKIAALLIYCRLANKAGFLTDDQVDEIVAAVNKPLPRRGTRAQRR